MNRLGSRQVHKPLGRRGGGGTIGRGPRGGGIGGGLRGIRGGGGGGIKLRRQTGEGIKGLRPLSTLPAVSEDFLEEENLPDDLARLDMGDLDEEDDSQSDAMSESGQSVSSQSSKATVRQRKGPQSVASAFSRSSSLSSLAGGPVSTKKGFLLTLADADKNMPFKPFCQKCGPLRPTDSLCLKPEELAGAWKMKARSGGCEHTPGMPSGRRRSAQVSELRRKAVHLGPRRWAIALETLELSEKAPLSRFDGCGADDEERPHCLSQDPNLPKVMHTLTPWEITLLECWAMQHVRKQYLEVCVIAHAETPLEKNKHRDNMHSSTICQLVRKAAKNQLDEVERAFMIARLRHYPLLRDLPQHMLGETADLLDVRSFARGQTIFELGDAVDGIYIIVQGDAELTSGDVDTLDSSSNVKSAPAAILLEDAIDPTQKKRPFFLKPERVRSRTARAYDDEDASTIAMFLWLPMSVLVKASNYYRRREAKDRVEIVTTLFAPTLRLDKKLCEKNCALFELETFQRNHAIMHAGCKPAMTDARLGIIVEGEVRLVRPQKDKTKKVERVKDVLGAGRLLGESALYGVPYPHYTVVISDSLKLLSIKVSDFLEKLMLREVAPLDKPLICAGTMENRSDEAKQAQAPVIDLLKEKEKRQEAAVMHKALMKQTQREILIATDASDVKAEEWKTVPSKYMLKWKQPPPCRPHKSVSGERDEMTSFYAPTDLNYPREFDLYPEVQRSVLAAQRMVSDAHWPVDKSGYAYGSLADTTVPSAMSPTPSSFALCGNDSIFASLDGQIKRKLADAEELEVEHYLHTSMGVFVEDADRPHSLPNRPHTSNADRRQRSHAGYSPRLAPTPPADRPQTRAGSSFHERRHTLMSVSPRASRAAVLMTCGGMNTPKQFNPI